MNNLSQDFKVDMKPLATDHSQNIINQGGIAYSSRDKNEAGSPILYDAPDSDNRNILVAENKELIDLLQKKKKDISDLEEQLDDIKEHQKTLNNTTVDLEARRKELKLTLEEFIEYLGKGDDKEKRAWERAFKILSLNETRFKETVARINKALSLKKSLI